MVQWRCHWGQMAQAEFVTLYTYRLQGSTHVPTSPSLFPHLETRLACLLSWPSGTVRRDSTLQPGTDRRGSAASNQKSALFLLPKALSGMLCCCQYVHNLMASQFSNWWLSGHFGKENNLFCQSLNMEWNVNQNVPLSYCLDLTEGPVPAPAGWGQHSTFSCFTVSGTRREGRASMEFCLPGYMGYNLAIKGPLWASFVVIFRGAPYCTSHWCRSFIFLTDFLRLSDL